MKIILLPGNNKHNKEWIETIKQKLSTIDGQIYVQYYKHWNTADGVINLDEELITLANNQPKEKYVLFAKSAGALLALKGIFEKKLFPAQCIFAGLPINWALKNNIQFTKWLNKYSVKTTFVQNKNDPAYSYAELCKLLKENGAMNCETIQLIGDTHEYDSEKITQLILNARVDDCSFEVEK